MLLNVVGAVNGGSREVINHLRTLADVVFHQLGFLA